MAKILVIDDSPTVIMKLRMVLGKAGYQVSVLDMIINLGSALRDDPPDLIILDLHMPALSGDRVAECIRKIGGDSIPILIYSSAPTDELIKNRESIQAAGFVRKSDADETLLQRIKTTLICTAHGDHSVNGPIACVG
jgi:CheY-like chemotaxis protein